MNRFLLFLSFFWAQGLFAQPISWITSCSDKTFCLNQNSCTQGEVFLVEKAVTNCSSPNINYSYKIDLNNDNTIDIQSSNDTVSGPMVKGTHKITWKATDNCGSLIQCTYLIQVKDCQPPNLLCINGLTQGLTAPDCLQSFEASQFVLSLTDNCTPTNQIQLGIRRTGDGTGFPNTTSLSFGSCDKGFNSIEVWAKDGNGLPNLCNNYVLIQDGNNDCICNNDADVYVNGCTRTGGNLKMANFKLKTKLETLPGAATPLSTTYSENITDSCFSMHIAHVPFGNSYLATVSAERNSGPLVGVTTYDLVLVSKHILAIDPFTSVYQTVAADVNKSGSVTTFDVVETRKVILGIYDTFPLVPAWRMTRPVANPSEVANFSALKDTYQLQLNNLADDQTFANIHFIGIKYGDVNGSASLTGEPSADDRYTTPPLLLHAADRWLDAGEEATVAFQLSEAALLQGWQLSLEAAPGRLQMIGVEGLSADQYTLQGSRLNALWADGFAQNFDPQTPFFKLKVKALQGTRLSEALDFQPDRLRPEAYTEAAGELTERHPLFLQWADKADANACFYAPKPNPFSAETTFEVVLKNPATTQLDIYDLNGKRVFSEAYDMETGIQSLRLPASALPGKGVFIYRIAAGAAVAQGRLIRI